MNNLQRFVCKNKSLFKLGGLTDSQLIEAIDNHVIHLPRLAEIWTANHYGGIIHTNKRHPGSDFMRPVKRLENGIETQILIENETKFAISYGKVCEQLWFGNLKSKIGNQLTILAYSTIHDSVILIDAPYSVWGKWVSGNGDKLTLGINVTENGIHEWEQYATVLLGPLKLNSNIKERKAFAVKRRKENIVH